MNMFNGPHRYGPRWKAEERNREIVRERCVSIVVTPDELAASVNGDGPCEYKARDLVNRLLERAEAEAVARTFGITL